MQRFHDSRGSGRSPLPFKVRFQSFHSCCGFSNSELELHSKAEKSCRGTRLRFATVTFGVWYNHQGVPKLDQVAFVGPFGPPNLGLGFPQTNIEAQKEAVHSKADCVSLHICLGQVSVLGEGMWGGGYVHEAGFSESSSVRG